METFSDIVEFENKQLGSSEYVYHVDQELSDIIEREHNYAALSLTRRCMEHYCSQLKIMMDRRKYQIAEPSKIRHCQVCNDHEMVRSILFKPIPQTDTKQYQPSWEQKSYILLESLMSESHIIMDNSCFDCNENFKKYFISN